MYTGTNFKWCGSSLYPRTVELDCRQHSDCRCDCRESRSTPVSGALCNYYLVLYWPYFAGNGFYSALRRAP